MPLILTEIRAAGELPVWAFVLVHSIALPFIFMKDLSNRCNQVRQCQQFLSKVTSSGPTSPTTLDLHSDVGTSSSEKFQEWMASLPNLPIEENLDRAASQALPQESVWSRSACLLALAFVSLSLLSLLCYLLQWRRKQENEATPPGVSDVDLLQSNGRSQPGTASISDIPTSRTTNGETMVTSLATDNSSSGQPAGEAAPHDGLDINIEALVQVLPLCRHTLLSPLLPVGMEIKPKSSLFGRLFPCLPTMQRRKAILVDIDTLPASGTQLNNPVAESNFFDLLDSSDELSKISAPCMVPIPYHPSPILCQQAPGLDTFSPLTEGGQHIELDLLLANHNEDDTTEPSKPIAVLPPSQSYSRFLPTTLLNAIWGVPLNFSVSYDRSMVDEPVDSQSFNSVNSLYGPNDTNKATPMFEGATESTPESNKSTARDTPIPGRHHSGVAVPSQHIPGSLSFVAQSAFFA